MKWYDLCVDTNCRDVIPSAIDTAVKAIWSKHDVKLWSYEERVKTLRALDALWRTRPTAATLTALDAKADLLLQSEPEVEAREQMAREDAAVQEARKYLDAWDARVRRMRDEANAADEAKKSKRKKASES